MPDRLIDKTAIVTGAGVGMGRAIAELFAREGARVVIAELNEEHGAAAERAIREAGGEALFIRTDVSRAAQVEAMVGAAAERFGAIPVLVNNAGVVMNYDALTASEEEWQRCMDIDLKSAWLCARAVIPRMPPEGGSIINIASTQPLRPSPRHFPYIVAKGGMLALTLSMAVDFGERGIRANSICPGLIETPMSAYLVSSLRGSPERYQRALAVHPLGRLGLPEDVAYAALFFASEESSFVTGATLLVDGGRHARAHIV